MSAPLAGDTLQIRAGLSPVSTQSELENRFWLDDLAQGTGTGRLNLGWTGNEDRLALQPLGLEYQRSLGMGQLLFSLDYGRSRPAYAYTGVLGSPSVSFVSLQNYTQTRYEVTVGYRVPAPDDRLRITPRLGFLSRYESFTYDERTIGTTTQLSVKGPWFSSTRTLFLGLEARFRALETLDVLLDYRSSAFLPAVPGTLKDQRIVIGTSATATTLMYDNARSLSRMRITRWGIGAEFDLAPQWKLFGGFADETLNVRYPAYLNIPLVATATSTSVANNFVPELVTDYVNYDRQLPTRSRSLYVGVAYDLPMGGASPAPVAPRPKGP